MVDQVQSSSFKSSLMLLFEAKCLVSDNDTIHFFPKLTCPLLAADLVHVPRLHYIRPLGMQSVSYDNYRHPPLLEDDYRSSLGGRYSGCYLLAGLEIYKHGGPRLMSDLITLFQEMWHQGEVPQGFKDATIVHLYKWLENRQLCDTHRGISLLNIAGKIFARILLNLLNGHLE
ncbi:unnamed protein product [Schistocephalus solidus]|uniref:Anaphase-promoting complex subunit 1 n=1 Tax=Schistocephalus solidus TaxID=70667 RepID=A0A183T6V2_SCHSO|nr:unnamed protein product [Schistocephalus solidus]